MRVFVYQSGQVNGHLRANGLLLIRNDIDQWRNANYGQELNLRVLGSDIEVVIRMTLVSSTDWIESDPDSIAKEDEFIASAAIEHQMQLSQLRPNMMFDVISGELNSPLPLVLSSEEDDEVRFFKGRFQNHTNSIDALPEVASFIETELANVKDDPLGMIAVRHLKQPTQLPVPSNTWLPCLVRSESSVWDGVYRLSGTEIDVCVVGTGIEIDTRFQILSRTDSSFTIGVADSCGFSEIETSA